MRHKTRLSGVLVDGASAGMNGGQANAGRHELEKGSDTGLGPLLARELGKPPSVVD